MRIILLVDDDCEFLQNLAEILRVRGYGVLTAASGEAGLELARTRFPDVVISDVNLGGLDGLSLLKSLRSEPATAAIPVILISGDVTNPRLGMELGADDYLIKPFDCDALICAIEVRLERQRELRLHAEANEAKLLEILSATQDLVAIAEATTERLLWLNPAGRKMLGIGADENITDFPLAALHPDLEGVAAQRDRLEWARRQNVWIGESAFVNRRGERIAVSKQILAHRTPNGAIAFLSIVARDLTDRLATEQKLRESEHLYRSLIQSQGEGFVIVESDLRFTFANPAAESIFQMLPGELVGRRLPEFLDARGRITVDEQLRHRLAVRRTTFELELHLANGDSRQILVTGTPKTDAEGRLCGTYAVFRDITERKLAEAKLHLLISALEAAANGVVIADREGCMLWVNSAFTRMTGYSAAEAVGSSQSMLNSGKHDVNFYQELWKTVLEGQVWHGEVFSRRKDGTLYCEDITITPLPNGNGEIKHFIAIKQDVSERKRVEEALRAQEQRTLSIIEHAFDAIITCNSRGEIIEWNREAERIFGWTREEVGHEQLMEILIPPRDREEYSRSFRGFLLTGEGTIFNRRMERTALHKAGHEVAVELAITAAQTPDGYLFNYFLHDITERKREEAERRGIENRYRILFESAADAIMTLDDSGFRDCNGATLRMFGCANKQEFLLEHPTAFSPLHQPDGQDSRAAADAYVALALEQGVARFEWCYKRKSGEEFPAEVVLTAIHPVNHKLLQATVRDLSEAKRAEKARRQLDLQLRQAQKLESIGRLAAGIAHEINTPTQYVGDNTRFLKEAFEDLIKILRSHQVLIRAVKTGQGGGSELVEAENLIAKADLEYIFEQVPQAISETLEGVDRVTKIVRAMKEFSHPGGKEMALANLNQAIETTVTVARNEWKYVADLNLQLDPTLPLVPCFLVEFNQCVLNLVVNAAHAIADVVAGLPGGKGKICISTQRSGECAEVRVSDTGTGILEANRARIFEPFFTTKDVGKGTGQGLSLVYGSIVKRHGGTVAFETETGKGTTFILRIPLSVTPAQTLRASPVTSVETNQFAPPS